MHHLPIDNQYREPNDATKDNYYRIAELLIAHGADVNVRTHEWFPGWSPIHWAAEYWNLDMVKLLVDKDATINVDKNISGETPLGEAIKKKNAVIDSLTEIISLQNGVISALKDDF
jgi:ankyrin repeat protein